MKKLLQICLIVVLVFVLFQAVAGGAGMASGQTDLVATSHNSSAINASAEGAHVSTCWVNVRGVICVKPLVGWNS